MPRINTPAPDAREYYPQNKPPIATLLQKEDLQDIPKLFHPLTIRGVMFPNRIFVSPMCQYSSENGHATDWHLVHIGGFATRGVGAICMEATAVTPEGRISPEDAGLWTDSQIAPLKRVVDFVHSHGGKIGIQLAHAGRKASTLAPWTHHEANVAAREKGKEQQASSWVAEVDEKGWPDDVLAPSAIPYSDTYPKPKELTKEGMKRIEDAFVAAVHRCKEAGFDFINIHFAHGYLLSAFLSPLSNTRTDTYGGDSLPNRLRFPLEIATACRAAWSGPLFVRISASDFAQGLGEEGSEVGGWKWWGVEQSKVLAIELRKVGVDMVDVSSGGVWEKESVEAKPGYNVPFAQAIKDVCPDVPIAVVGQITCPKHANSILESGHADAICIAREFIRTPYWATNAAAELGVSVKVANQYVSGWMGLVPAPGEAKPDGVSRKRARCNEH